MRHARVAAASARSPTPEMSLVRCGTRAAVPPTKMAREATWANPQSAYPAITAERGDESVPSASRVARSWYAFTSVRTALSPMRRDTSNASAGGTPITSVKG
ncbi:MAG TPA: hypothetical protein VFU42_05175 [Candidatus Deferrimicrobiaceae bacterium]|nr:hypothetical protein [Candidatus Deferrimicrobiaceae bacterium]